jgi:hypothetical protein
MENKENMKELDVRILQDSAELSALIKFLEKTKDGQYAEIEETSLDYSRLSSEVDSIDIEENYYYSLS